MRTYYILFLLFFVIPKNIISADLQCVDIRENNRIKNVSYGAQLLVGRLSSFDVYIPDRDCFNNLPNNSYQ